MERKDIIKIIFAVFGVVILFVVVSLSGRMAEDVPADSIVVIQDPIDGDLHWHISPGMKKQNFGKVTKYKKSMQYWFSVKEDQGKKTDQSIKIRFNDGGHAYLSGSLRYDLPLDSENLNKLHAKYTTNKAIEKELIAPVVEKAVYMTGPLMSSKESYAERRTQLINYIEDQISRGVYDMITKEEKGIDIMTGKETTITKIQLKRTKEGKIIRAEKSPLEMFNIKVYNLSINSVRYDAIVEKQIEAQQVAIMQVQTAIAEAKQAEQKAKTVEKEGEAEAARTKWAQEAIKAKFVTEAQQRLEIAVLDKQTAEQRKQEDILLGQGEAERKKLAMIADGALTQKINAYVEIMKNFAIHLGQQKWVPDTQIVNGSDSQQSSNITQFMDILTTKALKDLSLDMSVQRK